MPRAADYRFWWFITRRCNRSCRHCLRRGIGDAGAELDAPTCRRLLLDWCDWLRRRGRTSEIEFGGANPLLREDLPDLLRICRAAQDEGLFARGVRILANPETLTPAYVKLMADCGVDDFPVSLDGLERTNDAMRGKGNFAAAVRALDLLREGGVPTWVKFTCVRRTAPEFAAVRALARAHGVEKVVPGRLILEGGGRDCADQALTDAEWAAFTREHGISWPPFPPGGPPRRAGTHFVVMAGGEFRPNRRAAPLGRYPDESLDALIPRLNRVPRDGRMAP